MAACCWDSVQKKLAQEQGSTEAHQPDREESDQQIQTGGEGHGVPCDGNLDSNTLVAAYLACTVAVLVRTGTKITAKTDWELADDLRWLAEEEWIDPETQKLAEQARQRLKKGGKKKGSGRKAR